MNRKSFIRRVEVQVGIILGVVMFSILGVFLGVRKGQEKRQEAAVVTKIMDETSEALSQKALEQAQAEAQSKEGAVAHTGVSARGTTGKSPLAQATLAPSTDVATGVAGSTITPPSEVPVPAEATAGAQTAGEALSSSEMAISFPTTHTVKANDTLSSLARKYYGDDSKWPLIHGANQLSNQNSLSVGQKLTIPSPKEVAVTATAGQAAKVEKQVIKVSSAAKTRKSSAGRACRVQQGDTLYKLARTYYGDESQWKRIYNANQDIFSQREALEPGDVLIIP